MRSFWLEEALEADAGMEVSALSGLTRADVCIVGGGYTGLWTAIHIKSRHPSADVVVVEADICGGGASGRNNGHLTNWASKLTTLVSLCGREEGIRLVNVSLTIGSEVRAFLDLHGVNAQIMHTGSFLTATNTFQLRSLEKMLETHDELGIRVYEQLSQEEVVRRTGSTRNLAGLYQPYVMTVQPALLARGLRRIALGLGVRIYERTRMTSLNREGKPSITTTSGTVTADSVVLALDAWASELPEFRRTVLALGADSIMTEPIPELLRELRIHEGFAMTDARTLVNVLRTTVAGRLNFGKGGRDMAFAGRVGDRFDGRSLIESDLTKELISFYPQLADARIVSSWRGPVSRTDTGLPFFGSLPKNRGIFFGHGYSGNGVGPSYIGGKILASLALRQTDEWSTSGLVRTPKNTFPREPIRYIGGCMVKAAVATKERAEDQGRRPSLMARSLASLAPSGPGSTGKSRRAGK